MSKLILTKRDLKCLEKLLQYGLLSTSQISRSEFGGIRRTTVLRRLRRLEKSDLISRTGGMKSHGLVWVVTLKGAKLLGSNAPLGTVNRNTLNHDIQVSEMRMRLEECGVGSNWIAGYVLKQRAGKTTGRHRERSTDIIPDALFSIHGNTPAQKVALEVELTPKSMKRYQKVLSDYDDRDGIFRLWYLVPSEHLGLLLEEEWAKYRRSKGQNFLFWSVISDVLMDPFSTTVRSKSHRLTVRDLFQLKEKSPAHVSAQLLSSEKILENNEKVSNSLNAKANLETSNLPPNTPSSLTLIGRFKEGDLSFNHESTRADGAGNAADQEILE